MKSIHYNTRKNKITRGWPPARRKAQAERLRRTKIWQYATGPKSKKGKAMSSQNARKHGLRSAAMNEVYRLLRMQRDFVKSYKTIPLSRRHCEEGVSLTRQSIVYCNKAQYPPKRLNLTPP